MTQSETPPPGAPAGAGRLTHVLSTRGTASTPERPFIIEHREALIYMLSEASELEHAILCQYLFAAFSLKQRQEEGLTEQQAHAVKRWRSTLITVAGQEMLHLALVQNMLSAVGGSPHLTRPNLPSPARHFPPGVQIALIPFGERAVRHFMYLERPEGMDMEDAEGFAAIARAEPLMMDEDTIVPLGQDFSTVGHLYRSIADGFAHLADRIGEERLFVGPPRAQATADAFHWPDLIPVTDVAAARQAIETIVEQGEGSQGDWREAHFGRFHDMLDELLELTEADPTFQPARPVMTANVRLPESGEEVPLISNHETARVVDLFNVSYEILLQVLYRFFAHTEETDEELMTLADVAVGIMFTLISPLGEAITRLPVGPNHPGMVAGPSFELFYETDYLLPHKEAAWILLEERLREARDYARRIAPPEGELHEALERAAQSAEALAERLTGTGWQH